MYKIQKMLVLLFVAIFSFNACKQDSLKPEGLQMNENQQSQVMYRVNGTNNTIAESQLSTLGEDINIFPEYNGERLVFTNDANLRSWANTQPNTIKTIINNKLDSAQQLQDYAIREGLIDNELATEKWIRDTFGEPSSEYVVGVGIVFDGYNCGGNSINLALPVMPSLFWMRNRTSSFVIAGSKTFCDRTWFRGTKWWYFLPPNVCRSLLGTNQDNRYESVL